MFPAELSRSPAQLADRSGGRGVHLRLHIHLRLSNFHAGYFPAFDIFTGELNQIYFVEVIVRELAEIVQKVWVFEYVTLGIASGV